MPSLTQDARKELLGPQAYNCGRCGWQMVRNYCRSCDVFMLSCACNLDGREHDVKEGHRVYVWTILGVVAIPDFD